MPSHYPQPHRHHPAIHDATPERRHAGPGPEWQGARRERALQVLNRHHDAGGAQTSPDERERWIVDAMLAFADSERIR